MRLFPIRPCTGPPPGSHSRKRLSGNAAAAEEYIGERLTLFYLPIAQFQTLILYNYLMPDSKEMLDRTFMDIRSRCLSLAADLDRLDRSRVSDSRRGQFREAIAVLLESSPNRAERIHMILSDKTPPPPHGKK
jgi:hypothetical protein